MRDIRVNAMGRRIGGAHFVSILITLEPQASKVDNDFRCTGPVKRSQRIGFTYRGIFPKVIVAHLHFFH